MYVIGFNGPPRSGKDTLAGMVAEALNARGAGCWIRSLSLPARQMAFGALGLEYTNDYYEAIKDDHNPRLHCSIRRFMIDFSEKFMRPTYGRDIYGRLLMGQFDERAFANNGVLLIPDIGFIEECEYLSDRVGKENFYLVRAAREGCSFDNDSRSYVNWDSMSAFVNNGSLDDWRLTADTIVWRIINQLRWKI
jgi:hypothetical protein